MEKIYQGKKYYSVEEIKKDFDIEEFNCIRREIIKDILNNKKYVYIDMNRNINCYHCEDCNDCYNCINCYDCEDCNDCYHCEDCFSCKNCVRCDDCGNELSERDQH